MRLFAPNARRVIFGLLCIFLTNISAHADVLKVGSSDVTSSAGIFIAKEKGFFKEAGLDVDLIIVKASGAPMTALLSSGNLDVGGGNISAGLFNAANLGVGIKMVADKGLNAKTYSHISLIVRADHVKSGRYKSFKDLKGFKMSLTAQGGVSQEIVTERFLKSAGLSLSDVTIQKMPYSEANVALRNKNLDATIQLEPYTTQAIQDGYAVKIAEASAVYPMQPSAAIFYSPKFLKRRAEGVRFMAAYLNGVRAYNDAFLRGKNKKEIIQILKKYIPVESDKVWEEMTPAGLNDDGYIDLNALKSDLEWYKEKKYIQSVPAVDKIVDHGFVDEALKKIGKSAAK